MSHGYIEVIIVIFTNNNDNKLPWGQRVHWSPTSGSKASDTWEFIFSSSWLNYRHIDMSHAYIVVINAIFTSN